MKRFVIFFLVVAMLACMCSCNSKESTKNILDDTKNAATSKSKESPDKEFPTGSANKTDKPTESKLPIQPSVTPSSTITPTSSPKVEFELGTITDNVYNNNFFGIKCSLPQEWSFYSKEQILQLNNLTMDFIDDNYNEALKKLDYIMAMFASSTIDSSNINIGLEKNNTFLNDKINLKKILEDQIPMLVSTYNNMGFSNVTASYQKVEVDGKNYDAILLNALMQNVDFYCVCFSFLKDNYMATVSITATSLNDIDKILSYIVIK